MTTDRFEIYCNLQELQNLPEMENYLFHNYGWKHHPAFTNIMVLEFPQDNEDNHITEAMAVYHELWKMRFDLPSLKRSWA